MGRALGIGASSPFVVFPCYSVIDCSSLWAGFCYPRHEEKPLNRAAPFRFAFLSAFSVSRSNHPGPSDARSPSRNPLRASQEVRTPASGKPNNMFNTIILIGRLGQNAEAKTAQNKKEYVILNIATQESWKNDKGDYENRTEWHRVYAWKNLSKFAKTLQKGQLLTLEGILRYREVEDEVKGVTFKHRIAEIHAVSMKRLTKIEAADDPSDGAGDE